MDGKNIHNDPEAMEAIRILHSRGFAAQAVSLLRAHQRTDEEFFATIQSIFVDHLGVRPEAVTLETEIIDDLGADSLDTVELVMAFEEEFDVEIPDEDVERVVTVADAVAVLEEKLKRKGA